MNSNAEDPVDIEPVGNDPGDSDPGARGPARGASRDSLFLLTVLSAPDGHDMGSARVRNLSSTGLMADCETPMAPGDRVSMKLRGVGVVKGVVAWAKDDRIGVNFEREIDPRAARRSVKEGAPVPHMPDYLRPTMPVGRR